MNPKNRTNKGFAFCRFYVMAPRGEAILSQGVDRIPRGAFSDSTLERWLGLVKSKFMCNFLQGSLSSTSPQRLVDEKRLGRLDYSHRASYCL